jgi:serine O-acetyltransferase
LFRTQEAFTAWGLGPLALLPHWLNKWINGCVIGTKASFGPGFVLIHPIGVVINSSVRGGSNVWLESSVVIGDNRGKSPILGNDIFVGSGAKIIGGVVIGDGAAIGANAVVTRSVDAGVTAVGIPAKALPSK